MENITVIKYQITAYAADFVCRGAIAVPSFRRLSDFINDASSPFLMVDDATSARWDGALFTITAQHTGVILNKPNLVAVMPARDAPAPRPSPTEVVPKMPVPVKLLASPLLIEGHWNLARGVAWDRAMSVLRDEFLIITNANLYYLRTNARVEENLPVIFVKRSCIGLFQMSPSPKG
ncbi:MAG: hypothetical protein HY741_28240 [Chloroflexi bacterium]|nr:hypothetical protein [Chloroflexota bacterium]